VIRCRLRCLDFHKWAAASRGIEQVKAVHDILNAMKVLHVQPCCQLDSKTHRTAWEPKSMPSRTSRELPDQCMRHVNMSIQWASSKHGNGQYLLCTVLRLARKILQYFTPEVGVPAPGCIPQPHAVLYEACKVTSCHVYLRAHES